MNRSFHLLLGTIITCCASGTALAGDRCRADADIEDICGQIIADQSCPRMVVAYRVEIEDARPGEPFDLVMTLHQHGRPVCDSSGRPIEISALLVFPEGCRDEFTFRDRVETQIPQNAICCHRDLEVCARVVSGRTGRVLDRDDEDLRFIGCDRGCSHAVAHHVEVRRERVYYPPVTRRHYIGFHYSSFGRRCR